MIQGLADLPNRGILGSNGFQWTKVTASAARTADVDPDQVLTTENTTEALLRILRTQRQGGSGKHGAKMPLEKQKRPIDNVEASKQKKQNNSSAPAQPPPSNTTNDASKKVYAAEELKGKTVKELQDLLKARSMPISGKKEALMQRLIDFQRRQKSAAEVSR
jgi:hypothetical protein